MKRSIRLAAACTLLAIGTAQAATNGTLGTTSTGTQNVSVTIQSPADNRVRVSGLFDLNLGLLNPGSSSSAFSSFCFYHTSPTFSLTVQQSEVSSPGFALLGPNGAAIPLTLNLSIFGTNFPSTDYAPANGVTRTGLVASRQSETCSLGLFSSGNYSVTTAADQPVGVYTGTLTFVMAVE